MMESFFESHLLSAPHKAGIGFLLKQAMYVTLQSMVQIRYL